MNNPDPYAYLQQVAVLMRDPAALKDPKEIEILLDEVEYLYDLIDPEMHEGMEQLMGQLKTRLEQLG